MTILFAALIVCDSQQQCSSPMFFTPEWGHSDDTATQPQSSGSSNSFVLAHNENGNDGDDAPDFPTRFTLSLNKLPEVCTIVIFTVNPTELGRVAAHPISVDHSSSSSPSSELHHQHHQSRSSSAGHQLFGQIYLGDPPFDSPEDWRLAGEVRIPNDRSREQSPMATTTGGGGGNFSIKLVNRRAIQLRAVISRQSAASALNQFIMPPSSIGGGGGGDSLAADSTENRDQLFVVQSPEQSVESLFHFSLRLSDSVSSILSRPAVPYHEISESFSAVIPTLLESEDQARQVVIQRLNELIQKCAALIQLSPQYHRVISPSDASSPPQQQQLALLPNCVEGQNRVDFLLQWASRFLQIVRDMILIPLRQLRIPGLWDSSTNFGQLHRDLIYRTTSLLHAIQDRSLDWIQGDVDQQQRALRKTLNERIARYIECFSNDLL